MTSSTGQWSEPKISLWIRLDPVGDAAGDEEVVDAPARILLASMEAVAPPAVLHLVRVDDAEAVGKARRQKFGHLGPLLVGEARALPVGLGVFDVHFGVGHIQVTAEDDRLFRVQPQQIGPERVLPLHPVVQPLQPVLTVGRVAVDEIKFRVFQRQDPPLVVVLLDADAHCHGQRRLFAPARCAGVALLLGGVGVLGVALRGKIRLTGLHFRLLHRKDVGVQRRKACGKIMGQTGPQTVDIPTDEFHLVAPF